MSEESDIIFIHKNKANSLYKQNNYEDALEIYNSLLIVNQNDYNLLSNRCLVYLKLKEYQKSINDATNVLKQNVNDGKMWGRLGGGLYGLGKYSEALQAYKKALVIDKFEFYNIMIDRINNKLSINSIYDIGPKIDNIVSSLMTNENLMTKINDIEFQNKILSYQSNPLQILNDKDMMNLMNDIMKNL